MNCFAISYDLIGPNRDYTAIHDAIKSFNNWAFINESLWIIKSSKTTSEIRNILKNYIDKNDKLFVGKLTGDAAWTNLDDDVSNWLHNSL